MTLSLKGFLLKTGDGYGTLTASASNLASGVKMAKLLKPAKVPTWIKDLTLETYIKQLITWSDILEDISEYVKYQYMMESLKTNKEVKGLPRYVGEHILPTLEKKTDQMVLKVLYLLDTKYGRTRLNGLKR